MNKASPCFAGGSLRFDRVWAQLLRSSVGLFRRPTPDMEFAKLLKFERFQVGRVPAEAM